VEKKTLYIQEENYHFEGYTTGVIVDEENNRLSLYNQEGILERVEDINPSSKWYELDSVSIENNRVEIKAKNFALYKKFFCLNIIKI
jgi:hypothetical protein